MAVKQYTAVKISSSSLICSACGILQFLRHFPCSMVFCRNWHNRSNFASSKITFWRLSLFPFAFVVLRTGSPFSKVVFFVPGVTIIVTPSDARLKHFTARSNFTSENWLLSKTLFKFLLYNQFSFDCGEDNVYSCLRLVSVVCMRELCRLLIFRILHHRPLINFAGNWLHESFKFCFIGWLCDCLLTFEKLLQKSPTNISIAWLPLCLKLPFGTF